MYMIDKNIIKQQFNNYVKDYDAGNPKIALKIAHTFRVADISERIAKDIGLDIEGQNLSWAIGMLHDIGRFEQVKRYNTFFDGQSVNHALFGASLLFEEDLIKCFEIPKKYYSIIKVAIINHNKFRMDEGLTDYELTYCKIIRDADKVDILRVNYESPMEEIYNTNREVLITEKITDAVYEAFFQNTAIEHKLKTSHIDHLIGHLSLISELEYPISVEILKEMGYLEKLLEFKSNNPETNERLKNIRNYFIEKNIINKK